MAEGNERWEISDLNGNDDEEIFANNARQIIWVAFHESRESTLI